MSERGEEAQRPITKPDTLSSALKVPNADPVHKVTIIPRGMALGVTQQLPEGDRYSHSRDYLEGQIAIMMGGRLAEEIFLSKMTTGASNDIEKATELAAQDGLRVRNVEPGTADFRQEGRADLPGP